MTTIATLTDKSFINGLINVCYKYKNKSKVIYQNLI